MQIILLERVAGLGQMGEQVRVKNGYARNFLLPRGKALRASEANRKRFERERVQLEARNLELRKEAEGVAGTLEGKSFVAIRQAGETGQLYGSVSTRDIAETLHEGGFTVERSQVRLAHPIKTIGIHDVLISLHPEVEVRVSINVARSADEAERQTRGEDLTSRDRFEEPEEEEARAEDEAEATDAEAETTDEDAA
ncbi:LSU ribosomal protein L9P [Faunimonas pinastri]|uniref:Large ribosomal subunit protein bL9 n=1 Tax=Faunimonas pinastri TaxID=1855383 RepID=A0A1H9DD09_9HYPH|nr:50S ribosomal protein L9 [Faunimonas pinastri]SEQ11356.1 LSU ribosomal protein L9P [Faunimonas pinastri]